MPGWVGNLAGVLQILVGLALVGVLGALVLRLVRKHMLWSLRNKLVVTYLLFALAPVVLFVTLVTISAYVAAGQFAIHLADSRLQSELFELASENVGRCEGAVTVSGDAWVCDAATATRTGGADGGRGYGEQPVAEGDDGLHQWRSAGHGAGEREDSVWAATVGGGAAGIGVSRGGAGWQRHIPGCRSPATAGRMGVSSA